MFCFSNNKTCIISDISEISKEFPDVDEVFCLETDRKTHGFENIFSPFKLPCYHKKISDSWYVYEKPCNYIENKGESYRCVFSKIDKSTLIKSKIKTLRMGVFNILSINYYYIEEYERTDYRFFYTISVSFEDHEYTDYFTYDLEKFFSLVLPLVNNDIQNGQDSNTFTWHKYDYVLEDRNINKIEDINPNEYYNSVCTVNVIRSFQNLELLLESQVYHTARINIYFPSYNSYLISYLKRIFGNKITINKDGKDIKYSIQYVFGLDVAEEIDLDENIRGIFINKLKYELIFNYLRNYRESLFQTGFLNENSFDIGERIDKYSDLFLIFNKLIKLSAYIYSEGERRVGRDDHEWTRTSYILPIEDNYRLPEFVIEIFFKHGIKFKLQDDRYRYFYTVCTDFENNTTFFGRSGGSIDNCSILLPIYQDLIDFYEQK